MGDVCVGFSVGGWWRLGFLGFGFLDFRLVLVVVICAWWAVWLRLWWC